MPGIEILLDTFSAIGQNFKQLFPRAVESLKKIFAHLSESCTKPFEFLFGWAGDKGLLFEFLANDLHLLAKGVVAVDKHSAEHVVGGCIERIEILLVLPVKLVYQLFLRAEQVIELDEYLVYFLDLFVWIVFSISFECELRIRFQSFYGCLPYA